MSSIRRTEIALSTWARAEQRDRMLPHRGYDDPTAHCFVAGVPRSMYVRLRSTFCSHRGM
jgi:hypothetical protein